MNDQLRIWNQWVRKKSSKKLWLFWSSIRQACILVASSQEPRDWLLDSDANLDLDLDLDLNISSPKIHIELQTWPATNLASTHTVQTPFHYHWILMIIPNRLQATIFRLQPMQPNANSIPCRPPLASQSVSTFGFFGWIALSLSVWFQLEAIIYPTGSPAIREIASHRVNWTQKNSSSCLQLKAHRLAVKSNPMQSIPFQLANLLRLLIAWVSTSNPCRRGI